MKSTFSNPRPRSAKIISQAIRNSYRVLYRLARPCMQDDELASLQKAFRLLVKAYGDRQRLAGEPAVEHPLEVASIVAEELVCRAQAMIGALLHEVIVETSISEAVIAKEFGGELANIVVSVTQLASATASAEAERKAHLKRILSDGSPSNISIICISLADCLQNMRRIDSLPADQQQGLVNDAKHIYMPLSHRLGLEHVRAELADLAFKYDHRALYEDIVSRIQASSLTKEGFLARFMVPIHVSLQEIGLRYRITGRTKSVASIYEKMTTRHIPFDEMHDLYAIRIVFESEHDDEHNLCWLIYETVSKFYEVVHDRTRNWLSYPKVTGYEALHLTMRSAEGPWVEVQIRSTRMDTNAEHGDAAHWKYKGRDMAQEIAEIDEGWLRAARQFLTCLGKDGNQVVAIHTSSLYVKQ